MCTILINSRGFGAHYSFPLYVLWVMTVDLLVQFLASFRNESSFLSDCLLSTKSIPCLRVHSLLQVAWPYGRKDSITVDQPNQLLTIREGTGNVLATQIDFAPPTGSKARSLRKDCSQTVSGVRRQLMVSYYRCPLPEMVRFPPSWANSTKETTSLAAAN